MTIEEMQAAVGYVLSWALLEQSRSKEQYKHLAKAMEEWICPMDVQHQDLRWLKPPMGKVIKKHG